MIMTSDQAVVAIMRVLNDFTGTSQQISQVHDAFWQISARKRQMAMLQLLVDVEFPISPELAYHGHWLAVGGVLNPKQSDLGKQARALSYDLAFRANVVEDERGVDAWVGDHIARMARLLVCKSFVSAVRQPSQTADKSIARRTAHSASAITDELDCLLGEDGVGASPDVLYEVMVRIRSFDRSIREAASLAILHHRPRS
jgi:hypothetical protein